MKKGYTLIEFVVVVAVAAIILSTASLSIERIKEGRALARARGRITDILSIYIDRSFNEGEIYEVTLDYVNKKIEVRDDSANLIEEEDLPSILSYTTVESSAKVNSKVATTTVNGGMNSFSVYIFDIGEDARYRISVYGMGKSAMAHVNVYKNLSAPVTWDTVESYEMNYNQWEKD